ncbi:MAG: LrgB family protein [Candidatus Competibacteraceae bacterium]
MTGNELFSLWLSLSASIALALTATSIAFALAHRLYLATGSNPLANPVLVAILLLIAVLSLSKTPYEVYFEGAKFIHFLLGPATVALAIPLYRQLDKLRRLWLPILVAVTVGVTTAALSVMGLAWYLGGSLKTILSLAPKSVTAPVAMGITEKIGGVPSLTAVFVIFTGIIGAVLGTHLFAWLRIRDDSIRGIAMGVTSHGIGTARAFQVSWEMGAFSGLAMALSAVATSVIVPWLLVWLGLRP